MKFLAFLLLSLVSVHAVLIPATRITDWTPGVRVGVPGGITNRTGPVFNVTSYGAVPNDGVDDSAAIQAAINAATAGSVVFMPAGTYRINSTINIPDNKDNITMRGAGMDVTIIDNRANVGISVGDGDGADWDGFPHDLSVAQGWPVVSGGIRGSTSVTLSSTDGIGPGGFAVGKLIKIAWGTRTEPAAIQAGLMPIGIGRHNNLFNSGHTGAMQISRITGISGSTITFSPAILGDYGDIAASSNRQKGCKASTTQVRNPVEGFGLEAFTITNEFGGGQNGVQFGGTYGSWILNVKALKATSYPFALADNLRIEVRRCWAEKILSAAPNGAGYLCNYTFFGLFEDNIVTQSFPGWEINFGSSGNVWGYNYAKDSSDKSYDNNHGPWNIYNLFEGNVGSAITSDGFFGGSQYDTIFRNWFNGEQGYTSSFKRFTRDLNLIGNVLGYTGGPALGTPIFSFGQPNIGNGSWIGDATPSAGDMWNDLNATGTLTTRSSDTTGTLTWNAPAHSYTAVSPQSVYISWNNRDNTLYVNIPWPQANASVTTIVAPGTLPPVGTALELFTLPDGFQEFDHDVQNTAIMKANWAQGQGYVPGTIGADTVPNSLYLSAKPTWFGNLTWPPFDPVTGTQGHTRIPAGYRFVNGVDPPGGVDTTPPVLTSRTIAASGTTITLGFSEGVSVGLGGNGGWTISMSGGAATLSYASGSGSTALVYNISRTIGAGETGTVSYTQPGNGIEDAAGNDLASLTGSTVTNGSSSDGTAPIPNPSTFSVAPTATSTTTITMTATTSTDAGTPPVQYFFDETLGNSGGTDSGWQSSPTYVDTGLLPGTQYAYRVQARDSAAVPNTTTFSSSSSATTTGAAGARPTTPGRSQRSNIVNP